MTKQVKPKEEENREITAEVEDALQEYGAELTVSPYANEHSYLPGVSGNPHGRPTEPDNLEGMLKHLLTKRAMRDVVANYLAIAKGTKEKVSPAVQLAAIEGIFGRLHGKPRAAEPATTMEADPISEALKELYDNNKALEGHAIPTARISRGSVTEETVRETDS